MPSLLARSAAARAALLGAMHLLVDAACVTAVWRTGGSTAWEWFDSFAVVFGYDLVAFATQAPLGALADRRGLSRACALAGLGLPALALVLVPYSALATMLLAGLGNSLFHLGAGASVLRSGDRVATPAGLFVAPGALGLGLGVFLGKTGFGPTWPLVALLVLALPLVDCAHTGKAEAPEEGVPSLPPPARALGLGLLFASVMIRSYVGFGACHACQQGTALLVGIALAAFLGKSLGGLLADRLGWIPASVGGLLASAPLIAFGGANAPVILAGLVLFQMTMPVTLTATSRLLPGRPALAFGVPSLALVLGAIPTFFASTRFYFSGFFLALILASAAAVFAVLRLLGPVRGILPGPAVPGVGR